jgi:hypothetical protein
MKNSSPLGFELGTPAEVAVFCHWTISADTKGSHISILVPFRTTKDSFLPVTFNDLGDLFPQLGSSHEQLCGDSWYLALVVQCQNTYKCCRCPRFVSWVRFLIFYHADILGRLGSNLVFIVPFGTSCVEFGSELWLVFGIM